MVFFIYTGTVKSFDAFLKTVTDLNDQYEISQFIAIQNGDIQLAKRYMKEQNFLIQMIDAILGWMKAFPFLWPAWAVIMEKLGGIQERNLLIIQKNVEMQDVYNQNTSPIRQDITTPTGTQFPDERWGNRSWKQTYLPSRSRSEQRWQPRPPPGGGRNMGGTLYPPIGPFPLPKPNRGNDLGGGRGGGEGGGAPPPLPGDWGRDDNLDDWWRKQPLPDDRRPEPDGGPQPPPQPGDWDWWKINEPTDSRRRCGY